MNEPDFLIADYGSIVAVTPMSADANKAVDAGLIAYEEWQLMGCSIMVDHGAADGLLHHLRGDLRGEEQEQRRPRKHGSKR